MTDEGTETTSEDWIIAFDQPEHRVLEAVMADPGKTITLLLAGHGYHAQSVRPLG